MTKPIPTGITRVTVDLPNSAVPEFVGAINTAADRLGVVSVSIREGRETDTQKAIRLLSEALETLGEGT